MRFDVLTLFTDMFKSVLGDSIIGRAVKNGLIELNFIDIREYTKDKHRRCDDYPFSGGGGMLMTAQPIYDAYKSITDRLDYKPLTIYMSPQGRVFNQECAKELSTQGHIILLCGHYEGVDQRVLDKIVDMEISIGDFVLTGGEIPAMAVIDSVSRLIPGVLSNEGSYSNESHYSGLLEYPQYTRPAVWEGQAIPDILLSGHHANIEKWKREQSIITTCKKRPDMIESAALTLEEKRFANDLLNKNDV